MGPSIIIQVMQAWFLSIAVIIFFPSSCSTHQAFIPCTLGKSFWNSTADRCIPCTKCLNGDVVLQPCELHKDALCGPISELNIDWSWIPAKRHKHQENIVLEDGDSDESLNDLQSESLASSLDSLDVRHTSEVPSSWDWGWDWQASVLAAAVLICLLFFFIAAAYSLHHARQWRLLEEHFEADVEELSTRLALMSNSHGHAQMSAVNSHTGSIVNCGDQNQDVRCAHLEQLLAGKGSSRLPGAGNVYIEESGSKT